MKTIIAGSRACTNPAHLELALEKCGWTPTSVISGGAKGADTLGENWARENQIPLQIIPADWNAFGKAAGHIRNSEMAQKAEALIVLWDGRSPGTRNMIETAKKRGLQTYIHLYTDREEPK